MDMQVHELTGVERSLAGKVAVVTGSTSGIGLGIARAFAEAGANVVINGLAEQIRELKKTQHEFASKAFQVIGDANKDISALRAEYGILDTRMTQLHAEIGRHISRNASDDPACAEAAKGHLGLVEVMRALRKSITLNYKLAEM